MGASHHPGTDPAASEEMLARLALAAALFAGLPVAAAQELSVYVTVAARVAEGKVLARTLEDALARSLGARSGSYRPCRSFCGSASQTRIVPSPDPDTRRLPSGLNATE